MKYKELVPAFLRNALGSISRTNEIGSRECWNKWDEEICTYRDWPQLLQPFHIINTFPPPTHLRIHLKGTVTLKIEWACSFGTSKHIYYPKQCKNPETIISPLHTGIHTVNFINDNKMSTGKGLASQSVQNIFT